MFVKYIYQVCPDKRKQEQDRQTKLILFFLLRKERTGAGKMAQPLRRTLAILAEDLGLGPSTQTAAQNQIGCPLLVSLGPKHHSCHTHTYIQTKPLDIESTINNF